MNEISQKQRAAKMASVIHSVCYPRWKLGSLNQKAALHDLPLIIMMIFVAEIALFITL